MGLHRAGITWALCRNGVGVPFRLAEGDFCKIRVKREHKTNKSFTIHPTPEKSPTLNLEQKFAAEQPRFW